MKIEVLEPLKFNNSGVTVVDNHFCVIDSEGNIVWNKAIKKNPKNEDCIFWRSISISDSPYEVYAICIENDLIYHVCAASNFVDIKQFRLQQTLLSMEQPSTLLRKVI